VAIPLSQLITSAQRRADMVNSTFVDTATWTDYANSAQEGLFVKVSTAFKDTFFKHADFTLVNGVGNNEYALAGSGGSVPDFRRLRGLEQDPTLATRRNIPKFNFTDRNLFRRGTALGAFAPQSQQKGYRVVSRSTLLIEPPENCAGNYRLYYVPGPTAFILTTDNMMPELEPWQEWLFLDMARQALLKEESDISGVETRQRDIELDMSAAAETDEAEQDSVVDVEADDGYWGARRVW